MAHVNERASTTFPAESPPPSSRAPGGLDWLGRPASAWCLSLGLAFAAQFALTPPGAHERNYPLAVALYAAAVCSIIAAARRTGPSRDSADPAGTGSTPRSLPRGARRNAGFALVLIGLLVVMRAVALVANGQAGAAIGFWLAGLVLAAVGTGLAFCLPRLVPRTHPAWIEIALVLGCLAVGFVLRYVDLGRLPNEVHGDEAAVGLAARDLLANRWENLFGLGWYGMPELAFAPYALALDNLGDNLLALRLASAVQGTLSIGLLFVVGRRLFGSWTALLAAAFLSFGQMAVHYSRIGNNYVGALFASLLFVCLLLEAVHHRQALLFLLAGYACGLTLSAYLAARLTLPVMVLYLVRRAASERGFVRTHLAGFLMTGLGAVLFVAPQGVAYSKGPGRALERTSEVFVLRGENLRHEYGAYGVHSAGAVLARQAVNTLAAFNLKGETSDQYGQRAPLLDRWSGALFVLGAALVSATWRRPGPFLAGAWLWLTLLLGSVLTVDAAFSPRLVAAIGVFALLPALALDVGRCALVARFGGPGRVAAVGVAGGIVLLSAIANVEGYFVTHELATGSGFYTTLARYAAGVNGRFRIYLLADADTSLGYDTVRFLVPDLDGVDVRDRALFLPIRPVPAEKGVTFVFRDAKDPRFDTVKRAYPGGREAEQRSTNGHVQFVTYTVANRELAAEAARARSEPRAPGASTG